MCFRLAGMPAHCLKVPIPVWRIASTGYSASELPESGESLDERPCLEWYLNDPSQVPEAELRTLICIPLKG